MSKVLHPSISNPGQAVLPLQPLSPPPPVSLPRLAFLGLGWIGRHRLEAFTRSGLAEICGLADSSPAVLEAAVPLAPHAVTTLDLEGLLALAPDGIVIATPSALHADQAIIALQAGCAVFCQKPLARTATETARVIDAARHADRLLAVDFSYRHTAGIQAIYRLIQDGVLGRVYAVEMVFHNAYGPDKPWFYDAALSGGGCLMDLGTHLVDLALWCLDFPAVLHARGRLFKSGSPIRTHTQPGQLQREVEDYATAQIELGNGAVIQFSCSWKAPAGCDARIEVTFFGTQAAASFRNVNGSFYDFTAEHFLPDRSRITLASPPDEWGGRAVKQWAWQLTQSSAFDPAIEHAQDVAAALDTIYQTGS
jgi:predicted dehydrogenase